MCGPVLPWTQVPRGGCGAAGDGAAAGRGEDTGPSLSLPTSASACPLGEPDSRGGLRSVCQRLGREAPTEARAQGTERRQPDRPRRGTEGSERPLRQSRGQRLRPETVSSHLQHEGSPETLGHQPPTAPRTGERGALPVGADARTADCLLRGRRPTEASRPPAALVTLGPAPSPVPTPQASRPPRHMVQAQTSAQ